MSLENINAPQFVDFSSVDTFDLHDGADFCFEKRVVGEDNKLDDMFQKTQNEAVETLMSALSIDSANFKKAEGPERKKGPIKAVHKTEENKENSCGNVKKTEIVGQSAHKVGSALDLVNSNAGDKAKKVNTPVKTLAPNNKQRTLSHSSSASSTNSAPATKPNKPLLPLYKGVRFIPKLGQKFHPGSLDSYNPGSTDKNSKLFTKDAAVDAEKKPSNLTRSTPGKSASFKQQPTSQKKNNIISNMMKTKPSKKFSYSSDTEFNSTNNSLDSTQDSTMGSRKKSDSAKTPGLLHTELRAIKRTEYDNQLKERERMAYLKKKDLEQEKMKKQHEEIQKLRVKNTFKSNPIKHFKPVEVKPSERPLTEPKSPQFAINNSSESKHVQKFSSSVTMQTTITTTKTHFSIGSH
ncbi:targeting for Xklp2 [Brachionus plicatilis]|uniref:Targeting for Xklp2 n=1 Tax=Brachionus plicatilis TaxID=10195 RepID=A0A3M7PB24_BRAPC|nr:targeting for Xklp2 [Brachionus plicatilis]